MRMDVRLLLFIVILLASLISLLARFVGPNLFIGFRIGFTMIDERIWRRTHELSAVIFFISSLIFYLLTLLTRDLLVMLAIFISLMLISTAFIILKSVEYAEKITGFEPAATEEIKPIEPLTAPHAKRILYMILAVFLIVLIASLMTLPETIAVRFDLAGNPVAWQDKYSFLVSISMLILSVAITIRIVVYIGEKHPIVFYSGVISRKWGKKALYLLTIYSLEITEVFFILVLLIINLYNSYRIKILVESVFLLPFLIITVVFLPFLIVYLKRKT